MNKPLTAFLDGVRRVLRAPAILAGVFTFTLLLALPAGHLVRAGITASLGSSRVADDMAAGINIEWWDHYLESASGLGRSFTPTIVGFPAVLDNLSRFLDNQHAVPAVAALGTIYVVVWMFLLGGILDRLARNRPSRAQAFFGACGVFFWRFIRLGIVAGIGYYLLFGVLHGWLFGNVYGWATRDLTVERSAFLIRLALYAVFGALLVAWTIALDYAKIRAVVEDRRSMLGAMIAGSRFAWRHPAKTGLLWLINGAAFVAILALYAFAAPGPAGAGTAAWLAFLVGQTYLLARLFLKLTVYASQTALFQDMLAHASYTAAPVPVWPESPSAEAIANAARDTRPA